MNNSTNRNINFSQNANSNFNIITNNIQKQSEKNLNDAYQIVVNNNNNS